MRTSYAGLTGSLRSAVVGGQIGGGVTSCKSSVGGRHVRRVSVAVRGSSRKAARTLTLGSGVGGVHQREHDERLAGRVRRGRHRRDRPEDDGDVRLVAAVAEDDDPAGRDVLRALARGEHAAKHPVVEVDELGRDLVVVAQGVRHVRVGRLGQLLDEALELRGREEAAGCASASESKASDRGRAHLQDALLLLRE